MQADLDGVGGGNRPGGTIGEVTPEYVLFDTRVGIGSPLEPTTWAENVHGGPWTTVYSDEGIVLAKRE